MASSNDVADHFRRHGERYGFDVARVRVEPVLNRGGFVNAHYRVEDGRIRRHLKLADDPGGLLAWRRVAPRLEARYRAPRMLDWVDLGSCAGALFEWIPGRAARFLDSPDELANAVALLDDLHGDAGLAASLPARGARESVLERFVGCMEADLSESGDRYPVSPDVLGWMRREVSAVRRAIEEESAFDHVEAVPIHGDPWEENVLVEPSGRWFVLDWDDLALGDPALDLALSLGPLVREGRDPAPWFRDRDQDFLTRFALCSRAALLEEVVDPLADWVEAARFPEFLEEVRASSWTLHRRAMERYLRTVP